jgi:2-polyprenyl-3-methyl-5-hydroxy-6-metoxy-1,4-benzoquinol methylase
MQNNENEIGRLNAVAEHSVYHLGANAASIRYGAQIVLRNLIAGTILEMGPAEGVMTEFLVQTDSAVTVLEGSDVFCKLLAEKYPSVVIENSLFEAYRPKQKFNNIILGHVLEHVDDPVAILQLAASWLADGGVIFGAVPNAHSLHRQAAVLMGLLPTEDALNEMDRHHGHRRVFNLHNFKDVFVAAGLKIQASGGYWLKPVSSKQIEDTWTPAMLQAFMQLGEQYPDIAGEIYVLATHGAGR